MTRTHWFAPVFLTIMLAISVPVHLVYGYARVLSIDLGVSAQGMVNEQLTIEANVHTGNNLVEYVHNVSAALLLPSEVVLITGSNPFFIGEMGPGPATAKCQWSVEFEEPGTHAITVNVSFIDTQKIPGYLANSTIISIFGSPHAEFMVEPATAAMVKTRLLFNATVSHAQGPGSQIDSYAWDFGDAMQDIGISPIIIHTYQSIGNYTVTLNVTDNSPYRLSASTSTMVTIVLFGDLNSDGRVDIVDVAIVAQAFSSTPETPRWNSAADLNTDGIVNIIDVALVAAQYGAAQ